MCMCVYDCVLYWLDVGKSDVTPTTHHLCVLLLIKVLEEILFLQLSSFVSTTSVGLSSGSSVRL